MFPAHIRMPQYVEIEKIINESIDVKTFFFTSTDLIAELHPGQFFMIYVFNCLDHESEEVPISVSCMNGIIGISVKNVGQTTNILHKHKVGQCIGVRGPYGNGYAIIGSKVALIGGGIGMAPLMPLLEKYIENKTEVDVFVGAGGKDYLCFINRIKELGVMPYIATNDGSKGHKGFIVDLFEEKVKENNYDYVFTTGPELMMKRILHICNLLHIPMQASLERLMKCSRGICGECCIDDVLVCHDGPVFDQITLNNLSEFGREE